MQRHCFAHLHECDDGEVGVELSELTLVTAPRTAPPTPGQIERAKRIPRLRQQLAQLEFVIDGRRLSDLLAASLYDGPESVDAFAGNFLSVGDLAWPRQAERGLRQLALQQARDDSAWPIESGRLPLYVCCMCADLACGAITTRVGEEEGRVTWAEFRLENGYMNSAELADLSAIGPVAFDPAQYRRALLDQAERMVALDRADAEH